MVIGTRTIRRSRNRWWCRPVATIPSVGSAAMASAAQCIWTALSEVNSLGAIPGRFPTLGSHPGTRKNAEDQMGGAKHVATLLATKPRRSRANLRSRSRSASVIDRLLKNQNHWKIVIIFDHPRRTLVLDRRPGNRAAILRSEIHRHGAMAVPIAGVRFGHSTTRRRGGRRLPPREDPP